MNRNTPPPSSRRPALELLLVVGRGYRAELTTEEHQGEGVVAHRLRRCDTLPPAGLVVEVAS